MYIPRILMRQEECRTWGYRCYLVHVTITRDYRKRSSYNGNVLVKSYAVYFVYCTIGGYYTYYECYMTYHSLTGRASA